LAHLAVFGANVIYGLNYVIAKGIMPLWLEPRAIIVLRVTGAVAVFWLAEFFVHKEKVTRTDLKKMAMCAFFGVALNQIMFFEGLNLTTPINASIIMVGTPIFVLIMAHFILKEVIGLKKLSGIFLGFLGASILILHDGHFSWHINTFTGNLFIFINAGSYGMFLVLVKPLMKKYRPLTVMKWVFTFGLVFVLPVSIKQIAQANFSVIPLNIWGSIVYVILFTTIIAYFLNNYSLKKLSPSVNSTYIYTQPFLATVVALSFGKDKLTYSGIIAAVLIFISVYLVTRPQTKIIECSKI